MNKNLTATTLAVNETLGHFLSRDAEMEYTYRDGQIFVPRMVPDLDLNKFLEQPQSLPMERVAFLMAGFPLKLSN